MEQLPSVPYVHIYPNLNYYFEFLGERYNEKQTEHKLDHYNETLAHAKKRAIMMYYGYHVKLNIVPEVIVANDLLDKHRFQYYNFYTSQYFVSDAPYDSYHDCYYDGIRHMLNSLNVKGVK